MKTKLTGRQRLSEPLAAESRLVYKNGPEKGGAGGAETPPEKGRHLKRPEEKVAPSPEFLREQKERIEKGLEKYKRERERVLKVIADFRKKEDPDFIAAANDFEGRIGETLSPETLGILRDLSEERIKDELSKLMQAEADMWADARVAKWMEAHRGEKIAGIYIKVPETKVTPGKEFLREQKERQKRVAQLLKEYERKRGDALAVLDDFKKKEDLDLRTRALQYENMIRSETLDPATLGALRDLDEDKIRENLAKLAQITETQIQTDERLAAWTGARERERIAEEGARERERIAEAVKEYNTGRHAAIKDAEGLASFFWNKEIYAALMSELKEGLSPLKPEDVKNEKEMEVALGEIKRILDKYKNYLEEARDERYKQYEKEFYYAVGRAIERMPEDVKQDPKKIELAVNDMVSRIGNVDLTKIFAGETWRVGQKGLTFIISKAGKGFNVKLVAAADDVKGRYPKVAAYVEKKG